MPRNSQVISEATLSMLKYAIDAGIKAKYVLFDSWFSYPVAIIKLSKLGLNSIAMLKDTTKIHYRYNGQSMVLRNIYK